VHVLTCKSESLLDPKEGRLQFAAHYKAWPRRSQIGFYFTSYKQGVFAHDAQGLRSHQLEPSPAEPLRRSCQYKVTPHRISNSKGKLFSYDSVSTPLKLFERWTPSVGLAFRRFSDEISAHQHPTISSPGTQPYKYCNPIGSLPKPPFLAENDTTRC